jgi:hypothetical protein
MRFYLFLGLLSLPVFASEFCEIRKAPDFAQQLISQPENRLGFKNRGGIINGGVCWWHNRFTRNAAFLAKFHPEEPKPSRREAIRLIHRIRMGKRVAVIPGYPNLQSFAADFESEIQAKLEAWQRYEGINRGQWRRGLRGRTSVSPDHLKDLMDDLYSMVVEGKVVYQKLQIPGIVSHAWLVLGMTPTADGYELLVHDSNFLDLKRHTYRYGMRNMPYVSDQVFVPYSEQRLELTRLERVVTNYCDELTEANGGRDEITDAELNDSSSGGLRL